MNDVGDEEELEEKITLKRFWKKWTLLEHMLTKEQVLYSRTILRLSIPVP